MDKFIIFSGTANPPLARSIGRALNVELGACETSRFPDGEVHVRLDQSVRGSNVFIVQPLSPPVDAHLVELLAFADCCRRAAAARVVAVVPYFGYARSDKRHERRESIMASMVASVMQAAGIDHVITIDLHAPQIEGFFHVPVDSLTAVPLLCDAIRKELSADTVVVSPDSGRVKTAVDYAHHLNTSLVVIHKQRLSGTETDVVQLVGNVRGRACLIIDDMISTGGTIASSVQALLEAGARPEMSVAATHGVFAGQVREKLAHPALKAIYVTDTIRFDHPDWKQVKVASTGRLLASAIQRLVSRKAGENHGH